MHNANICFCSIAIMLTLTAKILLPASSAAFGDIKSCFMCSSISTNTKGTCSKCKKSLTSCEEKLTIILVPLFKSQYQSCIHFFCKTCRKNLLKLNYKSQLSEFTNSFLCSFDHYVYTFGHGITWGSSFVHVFLTCTLLSWWCPWSLKALG